MENVDSSGLIEIIKKISGVKILVVGDIMLDRYWWGDVTRISPEAPVPVVRLRKDSYAPGGAANVAANVSGLGATAYLIGVVGKDADAETFRRMLGEANISSEYLLPLEKRSTTVKVRVIAHSQQVVRVDQETVGDLDPDEEELFWPKIEKALDMVDLVIVSDYGKGVLTHGILRRLISKASELGKKVLIDPKGKDFTKYKGASLLTPNRREAAEACHLEAETSDLIDKAGEMLLSSLELDALLITRSEDGMTLFRRGVEAEHLDAVAREIYDVTGAGDTVIACMGAAIAAEANYVQAAQIANLGAGLVVEQIGTTSITAARIISVLE